jgi:hypothetical protein
MLEPESLQPLVLGIVAGILLVALSGRWVRLVFGLPEPGATVPPAARRRVFGIPLAVLVHPTPWILLVALPTAVYHGLDGDGSGQAARFFGALAAVIVLWLVGSFALIAAIRRRRRAVSNPGPGR